MFEIFKKEKENYLIKNIVKKHFEKDFSLSPVGAIVFVLFLTGGYLLYTYFSGIESLEIYLEMLVFPVIIGFFMILLGRWEAIIKLSFLTIFILLWLKGTNTLYFSTFICLGGIMAPIFQIAKEWERAVILRLGKFKKVKGPGLFIVLPFIDRVDKIVDLRIRVTDFVAETTLTKDSVTVTVDALCYWLVWDAEKAILEVENYVEAVILCAQTSLRNAISCNTLSTLLENWDEIKETIRKEVDKQTTEWGITIQDIKITDIQIPDSLQDSMSRWAQTEREKKARIQLGEAEIEIAKKLEEASKIYKENEIALTLRKLAILNEGLKNGNSMIMIPSELAKELKTEDIFGVTALSEIEKIKKEKK